MGDTLWSTPAIRAIKKDIPHSCIDLLLQPRWKPLFNDNKNIRHLYSYNPQWYRQLLNLPNILKSNYDYVFIFHANNDNKIDLYVASGGSEFTKFSTELRDRMYINSGNNNFIKTNQVLPNDKFESSSVIEHFDYDMDGDNDLFIGIRLIPQEYGVPGDGFILNNDGNGYFQNVTKEIAPDLLNVGMVTDAKWVDIDNDDDKDLILVGYWMPITIMENINGTFKKMKNNT